MCSAFAKLYPLIPQKKPTFMWKCFLLNCPKIGILHASVENSPEMGLLGVLSERQTRASSTES